MHCNNITGDSATVSEVIDKVRSNTSVLEKHYPGNTRIVIAYIEKNIYLGMNAQEKSNCHRPKLSMYNKTRDKRLACA